MGRSCHCFPGRRKPSSGDEEEEEQNLKPPDTPTTRPVQMLDQEEQPTSEQEKLKTKDREEQSPSKQEEAKTRIDNEQSTLKHVKSQTRDEGKRRSLSSCSKLDIPLDAIVNKGRKFSYKELARATKNFRKDHILGEGGFGRVFKGKLQCTGQVVAVKTLNFEGVQGNEEFEVEITMLSLVFHPNIVTLIGYCSEKDHRLLVYEFMPFGSLEQHLHYPKGDIMPLDWNTRMKIAAGAARGLDYLHNHCEPCIIYRDMKSANILLGEGYHPKLSDLGLARFGPMGEKTHVTTRVMGTMGYCAPEYGLTGQLTTKSDTYSFGVVLLELVTGRKALDRTRDGEQFLIEWAKPMLTEKKTYVKLADPMMKGQFVEKHVRKTVELAMMCITDDQWRRPNMSEVVEALDHVVSLGETHSHMGATDEPRDSQKMDHTEWDRAKELAEAKMWAEKCRHQGHTKYT